MERTETILNLDKNTVQNILAFLPCPAEKACFFDIETTGLSPHVSSLYLIGAGYWKDTAFHLVQWFADDYISEKEILSSFAEFTSSFSTYVHYNGATFDIPYLQKKYLAHKLPSPFDARGSLDIYRAIKKKKELFHTPDMKLLTMEKLLHFQRNDHFTGKDCIELYTAFMQKKYFRDEKAELLKTNLLLHNHDDIMGTILCTQLLAYSAYKPAAPEYRISDGMFWIQDTADTHFPFRCQYEKDGTFFSFDGPSITIRIPLFHGTLYHFYKDYKNYFYLPGEDMAVHKSVGIYVEEPYRVKATAANCYTKKTGTFLPLPKKLEFKNLPLFQKTRRSPVSYILVENESGPLTKDMLADYIRQLLI